MNARIILLFTFLPSLLYSQDLKKITDTENREVYYVLKSDNSIRQGKYQKLTYKNKVEEEGYYKNGKKDSLWIEYEYDSKKVKSKGGYQNDLKTGVWEYYEDGNLIQKYDYTNKELIFLATDGYAADKKYSIISGKDTIKTILDRPPVYIGGNQTIFQRLYEQIEYPHQARENGIEGTVYINFTIDENGNTSNYFILRGIGAGCDEEALRVLQLVSEWLPGLLNGKPVTVEYTFPIVFRLN